MSKRQEYLDNLLAEARSRNLTPAQVRNATFQQVCAFMGLDASSVPEDFFYAKVKNWVARQLEKDETEVQTAAIRLAVKAGIEDLVDSGAVEVERTEDGWLIRET